MRKHDISSAIETALNNFLMLQKDITKINGMYYIVIPQVEMILIKKIYELTGKNKNQTAKILGISRNTLNAKMKSLDIDDAKPI